MDNESEWHNFDIEGPKTYPEAESEVVEMEHSGGLFRRVIFFPNGLFTTKGGSNGEIPVRWRHAPPEPDEILG